MEISGENNKINIEGLKEAVLKKPLNPKINKLDNVVKLQNLELKLNSKSEFLKKFNKLKSEKVKDELSEIFEKINAASEKIGEKVYLKDILEYKKYVKEFLNVATSNSHSFQNQNFLDRKGRYRNYSIVKTVDRELENLTNDFIRGQIDHMGILKKMDDIRGMLLDIMM